MLCGKIAAGKSTLASELAQAPDSVLISEDAWLGALYSDDMHTGADYVRNASRLRGALAPHVVELLNAGVSVVLDFPANTVETRKWLREILAETGAAHQMHVLDLPDDICLERLQKRNADGAHTFSRRQKRSSSGSRNTLSPPTDEEGFNIIRHPAD